jgi:hypothetical protein
MVSVSLSREAEIWVDELRARWKMKSFSKALDTVVLQHKVITPEIRRQEALARLREAAAMLHADFGVEQEALVVWVSEVSGGVK